MRPAAAVVLILSLLAAGCGGGAVEEVTVSSTLPAPSTTTGTMVASSTTQPEPTTTTTTSLPVWEDPGFPEARPPEEIPWERVGPGWLLVRYLETSASWEESTREALFLIDAEDTIYAVGSWDGTEILDWSPDGRRVLVFDGTLDLLDLRDGAASAIPVDVPNGGDYRLDARFLPTGGDLAVRTLTWGEHACLQRLGADGSVLATLADVDLAGHEYGAPEFVEWGVTWLFGRGGNEVAVATGDGIDLLDGSGTLIRPLEAPGLGCTLSRWWDERSVLAACYDADWAASACWYRGPMPDGRALWVVPVDGSAATLLTPRPVCISDATEPAPAYADGLPVGEVVAARTGHCCECGGGLDFVAGDVVTAWAGYGGSYPCSPDLVTVRPGRVVVRDTVYGWDADQGATGMLGVLFEVAADGTTLGAITPVEAGLYGGVQQVLTTEESGG